MNEIRRTKGAWQRCDCCERREFDITVDGYCLECLDPPDTFPSLTAELLKRCAEAGCEFTPDQLWSELCLEQVGRLVETNELRRIPQRMWQLCCDENQLLEFVRAELLYRDVRQTMAIDDHSS